MSESNKLNGLEKVEKYYEDYGLRAKELKEQGQGVLAFLCAYVPVEIIHAAGFFPLRIKGSVDEPITKGNTQLESIACPFVRSCFDLFLKGKYDFCEGFVIPHSCDSITKPYSVWRYSLEPNYSHLINFPRDTGDSAWEFLKADLGTFRKSLQGFAKKEITDEALAKSVKIYNENRKKIRELYELRKPDPPLVTGAEVTRILVAAMSLPVEESNQLLDEVIAEIRERKDVNIRKLPRILISGGTVDNSHLMSVIEDSGANVVVDNACIGTRDFWPYTDVTDDPMDGIVTRYLDKINCPKTYREKVGTTFQDDLDARFGDIGKFAREFNVDGAIIYVYKFCDPFGFEIPARKAYFESLNIPVTYIEDEYSAGSIGRLRTRIQAFIEIIE